MKFATYFRSLLRQAMSKPAALKTLGFHPRAEPSRRELIKVHKELALRHHPDRGGDPAKMQTFNIAVDTLLGKRKATPPTKEDYRAEPGVKYRSTTKELKPPDPPQFETKVVDWKEAERAAGVPSGVEWKWRTKERFHDFSSPKGGGYGKAVDYAVYGVGRGGKHIFVFVRHDNQFWRKGMGLAPSGWEKAWEAYLAKWERFKELAPDQAKREKEPSKDPPQVSIADTWEMKVYTFPSDQDLAKITPPLLKKLKLPAVGALLKDNTPFEKKKIHGWDFNWRSLDELFKHLQAPDPMKSKLAVVLELAYTLNKTPKVTVVVNGREHKLKDTSSKLMEDKGILKKILPKAKTYQRNKANLTKGKAAKAVLHWMAQHLKGEDAKLLWMLKAAGDQIS